MSAHCQPVAAQTQSWTMWCLKLIALFDNKEEFDLARAIYNFQSCYDDGMTAQEAYDDFDTWTQE
jgi:hypothetical protein